VFVLRILVVLLDAIWQMFGAKLLLVVLPPVALLGWQRVQRQRNRAVARAHQAWLDQQVATTNSMSPREFEELIARLLVRDGHTQVRVVGDRGDLGADVIGVDPQGHQVVVQCKRYFGQPVTSGDVQRFLGTVCAEHRATLVCS
jgi:HJR/Mrr/RecB family endonuclease